MLFFDGLGLCFGVLVDGFANLLFVTKLLFVCLFYYFVDLCWFVGLLMVNC